jgi:hypothetical protein
METVGKKVSLERFTQLKFLSSFLMLSAIVSLLIYFIPCNDCQITSYSILLATLFFTVIMQTAQRVLLTSKKENSYGIFEKVQRFFDVSILANYTAIMPLTIVTFLLIIFIKYYKHIYEVNAPIEFTRMSTISTVFLIIQSLLALFYLNDQLMKLNPNETSNNVFSKYMDLLMSNLKTYSIFFFIINLIFVGFLYVIITKFITDG